MKAHPVAWLRRQPLPIKVVAGLVAALLVVHLMTRPQSGPRLSWNPSKYTPGARWGGI